MLDWTHRTKDCADGPDGNGVGDVLRHPLQRNGRRRVSRADQKESSQRVITNNILNRCTTRRERRAANEAGEEAEEEEGAHVGRKYDGDLRNGEDEDANDVARSPAGDGERLEATGGRAGDQRRGLGFDIEQDGATHGARMRGPMP